MARIPQIGEKTMSAADVSAALKRVIKMGVPASQIAKAIGALPANFDVSMRRGSWQLKNRVKLTWLLRMIEGGFLQWVPTGYGRGSFMPSEFAAKDAFVAKKMSTCTCGRYYVCPCGCFRPESLEECLLSLSDVATQNAGIFTTQPSPNPDALVADLRAGNGSLLGSQFGKIGPRKPTKT